MSELKYDGLDVGAIQKEFERLYLVGWDSAAEKGDWRGGFMISNEIIKYLAEHLSIEVDTHLPNHGRHITLR